MKMREDEKLLQFEKKKRKLFLKCAGGRKRG